jgi:hypothetical protein
MNLIILGVCMFVSFSFVSSRRDRIIPQSAQLPPDQFNALQDFYNSLNGDSWFWTSYTVRWNFTESNPNPCDGWYGITCSCVVDCTLTGLDLYAFNLEGTLPATIGSWTSLLNLDLGANNFMYGSIPSTIGSLTSLKELYLDCIPASIGNLKDLQYLDLGTSKFNGSIPDSIGNLTNLKELYLDSNLMTGSVPASIGNLQDLQYLDLEMNILNGSIPDAIGNLTNLNQLSLSLNTLNGSIPDSIGNLTNLMELYLNQNFLSGSIPFSIGNLKQLQSQTSQGPEGAQTIEILQADFGTRGGEGETGKLHNENENEIKKKKKRRFNE